MLVLLLLVLLLAPDGTSLRTVRRMASRALWSTMALVELTVVFRSWVGTPEWRTGGAGRHARVS